MEFHVSKKSRDTYGFDQQLFGLKGTAVFANLPAAREFTRKLQSRYPQLRYQDLFAMGLIDEILHYVLAEYSKTLGAGPSFGERMYAICCEKLGEKKVQACIFKFAVQFPPSKVYKDGMNVEAYLGELQDGVPGWAVELEEMLMLWVENQNPAYQMCAELFDDQSLAKNSIYQEIINCMYRYCMDIPAFGPDAQNIIDMIRSPALNHPHSLELQLEYIRTRWGTLLGDFLSRLLRGIDYLKEVNAFFMKQGMGPGFARESYVLDYHGGLEEYERFSPDKDWMPKVVLLAKSTLVWLHQLSVKYKRDITRLDQIPDEELDIIACQGFNSLWLIGLWERSDASRKIKNRCGNPEAAASAYALMGYEISNEIGGWSGVENLRERAGNRGIRLASDMVPNHTGIESHWVYEHPEYFVQLDHPPFPSYTFNSENLSSRPEVGIFLEDHYYDRSDASVVFKRVDYRYGDTRYIYHGNDGTHMPWNDTAQLNFSLEAVREAVIQTILHVAKNFPIIRFDAAMTLAKKHIQRLWFPEPGRGGDIPSRSEHGMSAFDFDKAIPQEFWREVVDRCAVEAPDTLLLAEAFWMMEGYFVRTLGMHRVYNSAFMNMLKMEDNGKYRQTIKNTINFDKDILKRFVNFMNNPDEDTAIAQFGNGDKYFGVCTLMVTMPGLPMFGHGQIEGFTEKYGMEFRRAYKDENPDQYLVDRHHREIFPLMKQRYLFAEVENFCLFDLVGTDGTVNENVFAYTNSSGSSHALVLFNNSYHSACGKIQISSEYMIKKANGEKELRRSSLGEALGLVNTDDRYCLLKEHRSGLWYIRKSGDLHHNGLMVLLNGYQSQVYMEIQQVQDNVYRHYQQLHDKLDGAGISDIQAAIREIVLGPVHKAFKETCLPALEATVTAILKEKTGPGDGMFKDLKKGFDDFVARTSEFVPLKNIWNKRPDELALLLDNLQSLVQTLKPGNLALTPKTGKLDWQQYLLTGLAGPEKLMKVLGFMVLHVIQEENREWNLQAQMCSLGDFQETVQDLSGLLQGLAGWHDGKPAENDILDALSFMEVQQFLKINYYDQVRWYNKERMEIMPWWICFWEILSTDPKNPKAETEIRKFHKYSSSWEKAHDSSGCKLDEFRKTLKPPVKAPKR